LEQLTSLAESSQISAATLYYDAGAEQWAVLGNNAELMAALFPEKKKLRLGAKEIKALNVEAESAPPISVDDMLAAAEGRTAETKGHRSLALDQAQAAKFGLWAALLTLLASAAGLLLPSQDDLLAFDYHALLTEQPLAVLGVADLFLALMLALGSINFYPVVRFRATFGLGAVGLVLFFHGQVVPLLALAVGSLGLYFCTICISYLGVGLAAFAGLGGMAALAWLVLTPPA
jgi:hypothetical protein